MSSFTVKFQEFSKIWILEEHQFSRAPLKFCFQRPKLVIIKAATRDVLWKKVFLKISQNSQESEFCEIIKNSFFKEHLINLL